MDPAKRELAKSIRNSVKDTLADLTEQYFKTPLELVVEQGKACREPLRMLLDLEAADKKMNLNLQPEIEKRQK